MYSLSSFLFHLLPKIIAPIKCTAIMTYNLFNTGVSNVILKLQLYSNDAYSALATVFNLFATDHLPYGENNKVC